MRRTKLPTTCTVGAVSALFFVVCVRVHAQDPSSTWTPNNHTSLGMPCWAGSSNPNNPAAPHTGGCGCENTMLRIDGKLYNMESAVHGLDYVFPGHYNTTLQGDNSYFRIRDIESGMFIANVSQSIGHSFCAAVADHTRRQIWVFCGANARGNKINPGPCARREGCYVGVWNASFDDLTTWSPTRKALTLPSGMSLFNNDVALVFGEAAAVAAGLPGAAPKHQAVMILEGRSNEGVPRPGPFAINTGVDGDLGQAWVLLDPDNFSISGFAKGAAGEGTGDAPALRYDDEEGYYYSIGGGWITNGPARSRDLTTGSWSVSPLAPMAIPDAIAKRSGLPPSDASAGINTHIYTELWKHGIPSEAAAFAANASDWDWGATDPDLCCSDGEAPSFLLNTMSRQGTPANITHEISSNFARLRQANVTLNQWLRSYFP